MNLKNLFQDFNPRCVWDIVSAFKLCHMSHSLLSLSALFIFSTLDTHHNFNCSKKETKNVCNFTVVELFDFTIVELCDFTVVEPAVCRSTVMINVP